MTQGVAKTLTKLIAKRFPTEDVSAEIDKIHDVETLMALCLDVVDLPDAEALRARLAEAGKSTI